MYKPRTVAAALALSAAGLIGIATSEGWEPIARPPVPGDVPTGGFGSTRSETGPMQAGERIDPVRGLILLQRDASEAERIVRGCIGDIPLHQHEFDAFVSLAYNVGAGAPVPAHSMRRSPGPMLARDVEFGGPGRIWGTAETEIAPGNKVPTKARISLLRQRDRLLARETWSDPVTGAWEVQGLDTSQQFIALAQDPSGAYRPVAADQTTPEVTP